MIDYIDYEGFVIKINYEPGERGSRFEPRIEPECQVEAIFCGDKDVTHAIKEEYIEMIEEMILNQQVEVD